MADTRIRFADVLDRMPSLQIEPRIVSKGFNERVYRLVRRIPAGKVVPPQTPYDAQTLIISPSESSSRSRMLDLTFALLAAARSSFKGQRDLAPGKPGLAAAVGHLETKYESPHTHLDRPCALGDPMSRFRRLAPKLEKTRKLLNSFAAWPLRIRRGALPVFTVSFSSSGSMSQRQPYRASCLGIENYLRRPQVGPHSKSSTPFPGRIRTANA